MKQHGTLKNTFMFIFIGEFVACSNAIEFGARSSSIMNSQAPHGSEALTEEKTGQQSPTKAAIQNSDPLSSATEPAQAAPTSTPETIPESKPILVEKQEYSTAPVDIELPPIKDSNPQKPKDQENPSSENTEADRPIPITGGFLTCTKENGLYCAIDIQLGMKYSFTTPPKVQISVEINNVATLIPVTETYQPTTSRWHWKLDRPGLDVMQVTKVVARLTPGAMETVYQTTFLLTPLRVGDGTLFGTQAGCSISTFLHSVYAGRTYNKPVILSRAIQNLKVTIVRLCGP